jgi:hypothetical protein
LSAAATDGLIVHPADDTLVNMEQWWNDTDRTPENSVKVPFVQHRSYMFLERILTKFIQFPLSFSKELLR